MSNEVELRKEVRRRLIELGVNPYPHTLKSKVTPIREVIQSPTPGSYVSVAGRVVGIRRHGALVFFDLVDDGQKIQCSISRGDVDKELFNFFEKFVDLGDYIYVDGSVYYTKKGELTIAVNYIQLLAKALRSPPVKWGHRILDPEVRYRKRYLDIMTNPQVRRIFEIRFKTIEEIRKFMWSKGYMEVETPILQPIYGGAAARPFKTHIWALDTEWYLRISLELYLKRFIVAGFNKVFEIGKNFRNEDIDIEHNPEFTMMESYEAYADYNDIMNLTEELISTVARRVLGTDAVEYPINGETTKVNLSPPYRRISIYEAFREFAGLDVESLSDDRLKEYLDKYSVKIAGGYDRGRAIVKLFDRIVGRNYLMQPTFVIDFPISSSPLAKPHRSRADLAERFELYIGGLELANAYTELNDPEIQASFFREEEVRGARGDLEAHPFDWDFVEALEHGMPPTGGLGLGIDRLVMIYTGVSSIKEVIPFPMVKSKEFE
ncbi:MAG: lysine--tRNA ligase [Sulfolobales archaeon]|nr:lysine--tRNA ligase [Sulfolobales archaeon]MDW8083130.1 lysine--tRNA ligase [Sulfolobales archaeon]